MFARAIARTPGLHISIADTKQLMTIFDDTIYGFLSMVGEDEPIEIKAFNGIIITAKYDRGGKLGTGVFSGKKSKAKVKVKAEFTKYAKEILQKDLLEKIKEKKKQKREEKKLERQMEEHTTDD